MDLFTYLMAKNGNNSSVHGDLFSYLLGKGQSQIYTVSGTTIYIPDAKKLVSFMMTKESTQYTTTGKQLFDKNNLTYIDNCNIGSTGLLGSDNNFAVVYVYLSSGTYTISNLTLNAQQWVISDIATLPEKGDTANSRYVVSDVQQVQYTLNSNSYLLIRVDKRVYSVNDFVSKLQIEEGTTATEYEEYTGGQPSPNPDYPQEVKTVKGYKNLFDEQIELGSINPSNGQLVSNDTRTRSVNYIKVQPNTTYSFRREQTSGYRWIIGYDINKTGITDGGAGEYASAIYKTPLITTRNFVFTTTATTEYIKWYDTVSTNIHEKVMINEGDSIQPYVPYGNNYIAVNVSDGTNTNSVPLPLNGNEIVGIGDYKDEYIVDKSGHVFINKKTGKVVLDGSESWNVQNTGTDNWFYQLNLTSLLKPKENQGLSNYYNCGINITSNNENQGLGFSIGTIQWFIRIRYGIEDTIENFKTWLSTHNTEVYYPLETPELIDLQTTVDLRLFKGVNNISNSEDGYMTIEYR